MVGLLHRDRARSRATTWTPAGTSTSPTGPTSPTTRSWRPTVALADDYFEVERYARLLRQPAAAPRRDRPGVGRGSRTSTACSSTPCATTFPPHEHDQFIAHYRGLLGAWAQDERTPGGALAPPTSGVSGAAGVRVSVGQVWTGSLCACARRSGAASRAAHRGGRAAASRRRSCGTSRACHSAPFDLPSCSVAR